MANLLLSSVIVYVLKFILRTTTLKLIGGNRPGDEARGLQNDCVMQHRILFLPQTKAHWLKWDSAHHKQENPVLLRST